MISIRLRWWSTGWTRAGIATWRRCLYADDAKLECQCGEVSVSEGRAELESYWRPRLDGLVPTAFGLEEVTPTGEGVVLDYLSHEGKPVRILFTFSRDAKIQRTACAPAGQPSHHR